MYIHVYLYIHIYTCVCIHIYKFIYRYVQMCIYAYIYLFTYLYIYIYVRVYSHIFENSKYMYACIHVHTQPHRSSASQFSAERSRCVNTYMNMKIQIKRETGRAGAHARESDPWTCVIIYTNIIIYTLITHI